LLEINRDLVKKVMGENGENAGWKWFLNYAG
jgi:hypothetical protein